jgi:hypothetical protein
MFAFIIIYGRAKGWKSKYSANMEAVTAAE